MPFKSYVAELKTIRNSGQATENSYYTALGSLIEDLDPSVAVVINPKKTPHGSPDFRLTRKKNVLDFPVGWIEAKLPGEAFASAKLAPTNFSQNGSARRRFVLN